MYTLNTNTTIIKKSDLFYKDHNTITEPFGIHQERAEY